MLGSDKTVSTGSPKGELRLALAAGAREQPVESGVWGWEESNIIWARTLRLAGHIKHNPHPRKKNHKRCATIADKGQRNSS